MISKELGSYGEAEFIAQSLKRGFAVLVPQGDYCRFDSVLEYHGRFSRIQVKTTAVNSRFGGFSFTIKESYQGQIDFFAFFITEINTFYIIPVRQITKRIVKIFPYSENNKHSQYSNNWGQIKKRHK